MEQYNCFAGLDESFMEWGRSKISILPVPYDRTSTWVKGADKGPLALIRASFALELYDIETDFEVYRQGIYTCPPLEAGSSLPEEMVRQVRDRVLELLDSDKFAVVLGGEHSVSIGSVKAHSLKFRDFCVLQLDAHLDRREEYNGSRYNHACVMARIGEICPVVQVGIRSMCAGEKSGLDRGSVFFAKDITESSDWIDKTVAGLSDNVYVTVDLDVFDPSLMPSTGTPEPGGLNWYQVTGLLRAVSESKRVTGFDVVELCPNDNNKSPDFMAASLVYKFLSYIFNQRVKSDD